MTQTGNFSHIQLKLVKDAPPSKPKIGPRKENPRTARNKMEHKAHSLSLSISVKQVQDDWQQTNIERQKDNLPELPEALSLFLRIDPYSLPIEDLRKFGIEVISELEEGFVIGASADIKLSDLKAKIEKFAEGQQKNVASLWEIIDGKRWRYENILSPNLLQEWPNIRDHDDFIVDIGIACLGTIYVPDRPKKKANQSEEKYEKSLARWQEKRDAAYAEWDDISYKRFEQLQKFIDGYDGRFISSMLEGNYDSKIQMPDSFTCRIGISGKGLRDLVLNFPFLFDVSEVEDVGIPLGDTINSDEEIQPLVINKPEEDAPRVCVIDSGIQERHILLEPAIDKSAFRSWIGSPTDVADYVGNGGHGTRVAGAILFPNGIPHSGQVEPICWLQNARVLDNNCGMPNSLFPPKLIEEIVEHFYHGLGTRVYNHSINSRYPSRKIHMSAWAATIDNLSWEEDILFILSAGNLLKDRPSYSNLRLGIRDHLINGRNYPEYLLEDSCRIADPAQSLQAVTVGSVGLAELNGLWTSFSKESEPSSFSCTGPGIWGVIKPEIVEYGGDFAYDSGDPPNLSVRPELSPQLIRSTYYGGSGIGNDSIGTSFAAPKATHIIAAIQKIFPHEPTLIYRALLIQSARWPEWTSTRGNKSEIIRHLGYGVPDLSRATENTPYRITLITRGEPRVKGRQVHVYEVKIPEELRLPGDEYKIRIDITLSYKAQPRRTRRNKRRYLSTWLDWQTSKANESTDSFVRRVIEQIDQDESEPLTEGTSSEIIPWAIRERKDWGEIKDVDRSSGTIQKDWAIIKSHQFSEGFCIAVTGHMGWNKDSNASVPYALAVSFEAVNSDIEIYSKIAIENVVEIEVEQEINV